MQSGQAAMPSWAGAAPQQPVPVPVAISTPVGMTQEQQQATEAAVNQLGAGVLSLEERLARLEAQMAQVYPTVGNLDTRLNGMAFTVEGINDMMGKMEEGIVNLATQASANQSNLDLFRQQMTASLSAAEATLTTSLNDLRTKVGHNESMTKHIEKAVSMMQSQPSKFNSSLSAGGNTSFMPWKHMMPSKFGSKVETWREWQEDVRGYFDSSKPGIKEVLQALENEDEEQGADFARREYLLMASEGPALWRALKNLTEIGSDAHRIVTGAPDEDGSLHGQS